MRAEVHVPEALQRVAFRGFACNQDAGSISEKLDSLRTEANPMSSFNVPCINYGDRDATVFDMIDATDDFDCFEDLEPGYGAAGANIDVSDDFFSGSSFQDTTSFEPIPMMDFGMGFDTWSVQSC